MNAAGKLGEDTAMAWKILVTQNVADNVKVLNGVSFEGIDDAPPETKKAFKVVYKF